MFGNVTKVATNNISSEEDLENVLQSIGRKNEESNSTNPNQVNIRNNKQYINYSTSYKILY
jgi:hypothetical protein